MRTKRVLLVFALLGATQVVAAQDPWTRADSAVVRLAAAAFKSLPLRIKDDLERRGCRIPQVANESKPTNVIAGQFRDANGQDWAVLCSVNRVSRVLVYSATSAVLVDSLETRPDESFLQQLAGGRIGFSRMLSTAAASRVRAAAARQRMKISISHDGIEVAFVDKASSIFYWNGTRWIELAGSD